MSRKKLATVAGSALVAAALTTPLSAAPSGAAPQVTGVSAQDGHADQHQAGHVRLMPWQKKYEDLRQQALEQRLRDGGRGGPVERVGKGAYARVAQEGKDRIFVVLAEFGDDVHSAYPAGESDAQRDDGPLHNEIPKPDRSTDNSTLWEKDYDRAYYEKMYFQRMRAFYEEQSLGTYSFDGEVTEWVKVPFNQARYGRDLCGGISCNNTWFLIRDALSIWTQGRLDAGWTMTQVQEYLKTFDVQDRYDFDGDGDFDEPDGYIDHFQVVHAGGDQADGDPIYGGDAIWSHRWYAGVQPYGTGPEGGAPFGGVDIGEGGTSDPDGAAVELPDNPTGVWVGDYTIQPENGGLSVFAHEYGHDLGLPDLYDTSGNTGGAENSTGFWSLMSQSRGTAKKDEGIGDRPMPFGAWEKFQLGWLDYDVARAGRSSKHWIRPGQSTKGKEHNALMVLLPDKEVTTELGDPCATCGDAYYYSGSGNDLDHTMTRGVDGGGELAGGLLQESADWVRHGCEHDLCRGRWHADRRADRPHGEFGRQEPHLRLRTDGPAQIRFRPRLPGELQFRGLQLRVPRSHDRPEWRDAGGLHRECEPARLFQAFAEGHHVLRDRPVQCAPRLQVALALLQALSQHIEPLRRRAGLPRFLDEL